MSQLQRLTSLDIALQDVRNERERQDLLQLQGRFPYTCATVGLSNTERLAVLAEEFGEVARELADVCGTRKVCNRDKLRAELIQVAAVCVAWVEGIDNHPAADWKPPARSTPAPSVLCSCKTSTPCKVAGHQ